MRADRRTADSSNLALGPGPWTLGPGLRGQYSPQVTGPGLSMAIVAMPCTVHVRCACTGTATMLHIFVHSNIVMTQHDTTAVTPRQDDDDSTTTTQAHKRRMTTDDKQRDQTRRVLPRNGIAWPGLPAAHRPAAARPHQIATAWHGL